jgi:hypothetical protein
VTAIAYELLEKLIKLSYIADNLRNIDNQNLRYDFAPIEYIEILRKTVNLFRMEGEKKGVIIRPTFRINTPIHNTFCSPARVVLVPSPESRSDLSAV